jgi:hypothetical protein
MDSESTPLLRAGQSRLRALLAATAFMAVLLAIGRWAGPNREALDLAVASPGALPAEWVLVLEAMALAWIIAFAVRRHRLRALLFSWDAMTFLGGISMLTSGFFRYITFFASNFGLYTLVTISLPASDPLGLLTAWPMAYGAIAAGLSASTIIAERAAARRWRWTVAALFLGFVAVTTLALLWWPTASQPDRSAWITALITYSLVLASLAATARLARAGDRKIPLINLIAAASILPALIMSVMDKDKAVPLSNVLRSMGPGYWLLLFGVLLILISSIVLLRSSSATRNPGFEHLARETRT